MKYLVFFFVTVAVASASIFGGKTVNVLDDGTIIIKTETGKQMMISKQMGPLGQKMIEIEVNGPTGMGKKIMINDDNQVNVIPEMMNYKTAPRMWDDMDEMMMRYKRSKMPAPTQADMMTEIMKEFQGVVDEPSYEKLLAKVQKSVTKGKISPEILDQLKMMAQEQPWSTTNTGMMDSGMQTPMLNKWGMMGQNMWQNPFMGQPMMNKQWPMTGMTKNMMMGDNMMYGREQPMMMNKQWPMTAMNKNMMMGDNMMHGMDMGCMCTLPTGMQVPCSCGGWSHDEMMRMKRMVPMSMSPMGMSQMGMSPMGMSTVQNLPWVQNSMGMTPLMYQRMMMSEPMMGSNMMSMKDMAAVNMMKWNPWMKANWQQIPFTRMWMNSVGTNTMA